MSFHYPPPLGSFLGLLCLCAPLLDFCSFSCIVSSFYPLPFTLHSILSHPIPSHPSHPLCIRPYLYLPSSPQRYPLPYWKQKKNHNVMPRTHAWTHEWAVGSGQLSGLWYNPAVQPSKQARKLSVCHRAIKLPPSSPIRPCICRSIRAINPQTLSPRSVFGCLKPNRV